MRNRETEEERLRETLNSRRRDDDRRRRPHIRIRRSRRRRAVAKSRRGSDAAKCEQWRACDGVRSEETNRKRRCEATATTRVQSPSPTSRDAHFSQSTLCGLISRIYGKQGRENRSESSHWIPISLAGEASEV